MKFSELLNIRKYTVIVKEIKHEYRKNKNTSQDNNKNQKI